MLKKDKTFIIAEAGVNHNGDLSLAKQLVDFAKVAGEGACDLPANKTVVENTKTGLPFCKGK